MPKAKKIQLVEYKSGKLLARVSPNTSKKAAAEAERRLRAQERKSS